MRVPVAALLVLLSSGCVSPFGPDALTGGASKWTFETEPSMAPDFSGMGDTFPILLIHEHNVASQRQQDYDREHPVVCLDLGRVPVETPPARDSSAMASAPCMGPPADPATGRVFSDRTLFDDRHAVGLAARLGSCGGGIVFLGPEMRSFIVPERGHDFVVALLDDRSFTVDGIRVPRGSALKVGYEMGGGSDYDRSYVRVVFDHPGEWRKDRIAPYGALDDGVLPRPDQGSGLAVDVPLSPPSLRAPLDAIVNATPGRVRAIEELRMVHDASRLTEVTVRLATDRGSVTWYGAGRTGDAMRLLGAGSPPRPGPATDAAAVAKAFDVPWTALREGASGLVDVRLHANVSWSSTGGRALAAGVPPGLDGATPCDDPCVLARGQDATGAWSWQRMLLPQRGAAEDALTLQVVSWADTVGHARWWTAVAR